MRRGFLALLAAFVLAPAAHAGGPTLTLGAAEDVVRSSSLVEAKAQMTLLQLAGFRAVRVTSIWKPGELAPSASERRILENVAAAAELANVRVYVSVFHAGSRTTPLTPEDRTQFAAFAADLARTYPSFRDVIVGNEPNLNRFWLPQFAADGSGASAPAYLTLLAETYDALKAVSPGVRVIGGALAPRGVDRPGTGRDTISPTRFIRELGAAYRGEWENGARDGRLRLPSLRRQLESLARPAARPIRITSGSSTIRSSSRCSRRRSTAQRRPARRSRSSTTSSVSRR